jgi:hypothetical protein
MYLVGNYRYGTNVVTPRGVLTPLAQKNYGNPPKPDQTQEFGAKTRGYVVLSRVIFRSKSLKISLRACWFKSGPGSVILVNTCQRIGKKKQSECSAFIRVPQASEVGLSFSSSDAIPPSSVGNKALSMPALCHAFYLSTLLSASLSLPSAVGHSSVAASPLS